ncbi:MFS transporter [Kutzneria kofuensis]|uniref:Putative MFS family arabinose efflux permease n=1 Tax=Kutzneria kofuensis TaxID=103725 RepID=A0A7W9KAY8_9PSEU|nr:MFS transporter [Kutzneria kofuensis]MBB5889242.1 putative MFS family arabinose efflux permease [Kutzneria kofuensis]
MPNRWMIPLLTLACAVCVATIYFPQAISPLIAADLHVTPSAAAQTATGAQLGYALGVFLLVPLGDRLRARPLIVVLMVLTAAAMLTAASATNLPLLLVAGTLAGVFTVVPQVIIPMVAGLVPDNRRGAVVGMLLGGVLAGILLARTFGGVLGEWLGWRAPYVVAAVIILVLAAVLAVTVPRTEPSAQHNYPSLLAEALRLLRSESELRRSALYQVLLFGGFSAAWTCLALLISGPRYGLGAQTVGLIGLAGAVSVFVTPIAGRWIDRKGPDPVSMIAIIGVIAASGVLAFGLLGGVAGLVLLIGGLVLLDVAVQCNQVANQSRIFALLPEARSRLNTAYMTCTFLGGTLGSWLGVQAYDLFGWGAVTGLIALAALAALGRHLAHRSVSARPGTPEPASSAPSAATPR